MKKLSELFKKYKAVLFIVAATNGATGIAIYNAVEGAAELHDKTRAELNQAKGD